MLCCIKVTRMVRRILLGVFGALALLLGACADPVKDEVAALSVWAESDPVMRELTFTRVVAGGFESSVVSVGGELNVDSVPAYIDALVALRGKEKEATKGAITEFTSHVSADIGGTTFSWEGPFPEEAFGAESAEMLAPFAAPAVEKVEVTASGSDGGFAGRVYREASISDGEARDFRDAAYEQLGADGRSFTLSGFPPVGRLLLDSESATHAELLAHIDRVAAASRMRLDAVDNHGRNSVWDFYTEEPFDDAGVRAVVELLASPVDGKTATLIIRGPDGKLGTAYAGRPRDTQPAGNEPWSAQLQAIAAS